MVRVFCICVIPEKSGNQVPQAQEKEKRDLLVGN